MRHDALIVSSSLFESAARSRFDGYRERTVKWTRTILILGIVAAPTAGSGAAQNRPGVPRYVCNAGYTQLECDREMAVLKKVLDKYPVAKLGEWTWVIVQTDEWRSTLQTRGLDPNTPALTYSAKRQTFFEQALLLKASVRGSALSERWQLAIEDLLDLAVRHELAHGLCNCLNEYKAAQIAYSLLTDRRKSRTMELAELRFAQSHQAR